MIETILINYLGAKLDVPVVMEAPNQVTDYVLLDKTGSGRSNHIVTSTFAIQSYGKTLYDAMLLNDKVVKAMTDMITLDNITKVELETDYNFTNTASKQYRGKAVFNITHY